MIGIYLGNLLADVVQHGQRVALSADQDLRSHEHVHGVGKIDAGLDGLVEAVIEGVGDDANDLQPSVTALHIQPEGWLVGQARQADGVVQDVFTGKVAVNEGLVDDGKG